MHEPVTGTVEFISQSARGGLNRFGLEAAAHNSQSVNHRPGKWLHYKTQAAKEKVDNYTPLLPHIFLPKNMLEYAYPKTRMNSSRIRTVRCSRRLPRGGVVWRGGGLPGGVCPGGCLPRGVSAQRGCLPRGGVCPGVGGVHPRCGQNSSQTCENITFPQLRLRMVKKPEENSKKLLNRDFRPNGHSLLCRNENRMKM